MKKLTVALSTAMFASAVFATPITDIDFTQKAYQSPIDGKTTTGWFSTVEDPALKINITETKGGTLRWANENSITGYDGDGIGVGDDEICGTSQEVMIEFSRSVRLHEFEVLDLFYEKNNCLQTSPVFGGYFETGYYTVDGTNKTQFFALNQDVNLIPEQKKSPGLYGQLIKDVPGGLIIDKITFGSYDQVRNLGGNNDFAIARLKVSSVPEPNLVMLLGFGLLSMLGLPGFRRKK